MMWHTKDLVAESVSSHCYMHALRCHRLGKDGIEDDDDGHDAASAVERDARRRRAAGISALASDDGRDGACDDDDNNHAERCVTEFDSDGESDDESDGDGGECGGECAIGGGAGAADAEDAAALRTTTTGSRRGLAAIDAALKAELGWPPHARALVAAVLIARGAAKALAMRAEARK